MADVGKGQHAGKAQPAAALGRPRGLTVSKSTGRVVGLLITYTLLIVGATIMIFPMFWMLTASLKPEWQVLAHPPIWIPSEWIHVRAGNTTQEFPVWYATDKSGERQEVLEIGSRRYTTVVDASALPELISVPTEELSSAQRTTIGEITLNVRAWTAGDGSTQQVVALARDGDNLVVATVDALLGVAREMPLDEVNAGRRTRVEVEEYQFQAREFEAQGLTVIPLGPESQLTIVAPTTVAAEAILVPADAPGDPEFMPLGNSELQLYTVAGHPPDELYVLLSSESWQPVIDLEEVRDFGFAIQNDALAGNPEIHEFNSASMPVDTLTLEDGSQMDVVVLIETSQQSFVIPVEHATTIRLSPVGKLVEPFVERMGGTAVRYLDDYVEHGERQSIAIVGERRDMALVAPQSAITDAFDVPSESLERMLVISFLVQNYIDVLSKDLGGASFFTFFYNSSLLVILNLIGHFLSVTIVAYGFARLRAPGKDFLFVILLSTMMLPWPVMLIPQYEIFQSFDMLNTLWPLFMRAFFGNPFLIFLLRQFFLTIPTELEDAARIDGANTLQVLWHIMLPLSKPALATIGIFTFWWTWNSFFEPFIYLNSIKNFTVSLGLGFFKSQYAYTFHLLMAASMIAIVPIILIFFFAQRYFIEGIQLSGLKG
jgi:multiple sugar transport system permease protein